MLIYGAFVIPVLCSIYLLVFHKKQTAWWEFLVLFGICIPVIFGAKYVSERAMTKDTEYWGSMAQQIIHDEPWNEYVFQMCTRTVSCGKDCTTTETYDCSYVDYHSRWCRIKTSVPGETITISLNEFEKIAKLWGNKTFVDMKRNYHSQDGDRYVSKYPGTYNTSIPVTSQHSWENRVQAASDVFNFPEVSPEDKKKYKLFDYPGLIGYTMPTVLGYKKDKAAQKKFMWMNGQYGPGKRLRLWVLVFRDVTKDAAKYQEMLWKKGNKNEFVICIGINGDEEVQWAHAFTWAEQSKLTIETRDFLMQQKKLNLLELANFVERNVVPPFKKKDFREFNYLTVNPSGKAVAISYVIVLLVNIGVCLWAIFNGLDDENSPSRYVRSIRRPRRSIPRSRPKRRNR